ncbi:MAG: hypothetical protein H0S80_02285 [Desulfovibrionaceae bacterium]|nr:hypothetical protein [Desulfovibrionaceae bacterium]
MMKVLRIALVLSLALAVASCTASRSRMGMVQADDGLMYGSAMDSQFIVDSSLFENNRLKLRIRNTSGDNAFDLHGFRRQLEDAYTANGYELVTGNDFGILLDVNVSYSGQIQEDMSQEFGTVGMMGGGAAGGYYGGTRDGLAGGAAGAVGGATAGAALGHVIGSYITDDTYIIISHITLATIAPKEEGDGTTIVFGKDKKIKRKRNNFRGYRQRSTTKLGVYAGGRNVDQQEIVGGVRQRMLRILSDII